MAKQKIEILSEQEALDRLKIFADKLNELKNYDNSDKINVFYAAGLTNQEVKHSAFLGWLFDRNKPHGLGNTFLKRFIEKLFIHKNKKELQENQKTNIEILNTSNIYSVNDLYDFINDEEYKVFTELPTLDGTGRMDIVIQSEKTQTALIIENKTFTTTHDCQLNKYEEHYKGSKYLRKIFVFLTPFDELPIDIDDVTRAYRPNWCVFDYDTILEIVKELMPEARTETTKKLKMIMGDYIEMINTHLLLRNKDIQVKCKEIRNEYKDILELLNSYSSYEAVIDKCETIIKEMYSDAIIEKTKVSFSVHTKTMLEFFERYGETIRIENDDKRLKCRAKCLLSFAGNKADNYFSLEKGRHDEYSPAQLKIKELFDPEDKRKMREWVWSVPGYKV